MFKNLLPLMLGALVLSPSYAQAANPGVSALPERSQIPSAAKWRLEDIYASDSAWQQDIAELNALLPKVSACRDTFTASGQSLLECLKLRDEIGKRSGKLFAYARMHRDEKSDDNNAQAMTGRMENLLAETNAALSFIEPQLLALPEENLTELRRQEAALAEYDFYFANLQRQRQHILSPQEEALLARSAEIAQTPETVFNMLAHADVKFPEIKDENGQSSQLSEGRYSLYIRSAKREVREQSFNALFSTYRQYRNTFASTLNGNVKKDLFFSSSRRYGSALEAALHSDNVPPAVYDNLIDTVAKNLAPLHRYVAIKRQALGLEKIHAYDLYAPLVSDVTLNYDYAAGKEIVSAALAPLGPIYGAALQNGFSSGWIDVYETKGKQTGAYSWGVHGVHPFVLLNYHDRYEDVSTLAHEMGHALHSYFSQEKQPFATASYTTFCAEVASTTNEILLLEHMLTVNQDPKIRLYLLNQYLEQVRTTVYRQTLFAEFEKEIHAKAEQGETLTADLLSEIWLHLNRKYYGPELVLDQTLDIEWARIPHFYYNFYVYQYVTGYSAATALADGLLHDSDKAAQKRYLSFLSSGGSDYSLDLLRQAGVDMATPQPIALTLQKFSERLEEFAELLAKQKR